MREREGEGGQDRESRASSCKASFTHTYLMNAGGMSLFITWSSVVWTVSFPTCGTHKNQAFVLISLAAARQGIVFE